MHDKHNENVDSVSEEVAVAIPTMIFCIQAMTDDVLTAQNSALWDAWLEKYVNRLTADIADVTDVAGADIARQCVMNANNPR